MSTSRFAAFGRRLMWSSLFLAVALLGLILGGAAQAQEQAATGPLTVNDYGFSESSVRVCEQPVPWGDFWFRSVAPDSVPSDFGPEHEGMIDPPADWPTIEVVLHNPAVAPQAGLVTSVVARGPYTAEGQVLLTPVQKELLSPEAEPAYGEWSVASMEVVTNEGSRYRYEPSGQGPTLSIGRCDTEATSEVSNTGAEATPAPAAGGDAGGLAYTGSTSLPLALVAVGLMGCGVTAVVATRPKRQLD